MDLSKLSDADLIALRDNKLNDMSDAGLQLLAGVTPKVDNSSDFLRGFRSYLPQTKETFGGVQTLLGAGLEKALGENKAASYLMEHGAANIAEANKAQAKTAKESDSLSKAWEQGIGTVITDWLPYQVGSGVANLLETGATALGGAAIGSAVPGPGTAAGAFEGIIGKALIKKGVKEAAEKILKDKGQDAAEAYIAKETKKIIGSTAAMVGQAGFHGMGETTSRALQEGAERGETARDLNLARLLPAAALHSTADFISNKIGLGALDGLSKPTQNVLLNVAKGISITGAKEIPPELFQSVMERFGANLPLADKQAIQEYIDTAGAAVGMSVVPGGIGGFRSKAPTQATPVPVPTAPTNVAQPPTAAAPVQPTLPGAPVQGTLFEDQGPQIDLTPPSAPAFDEKLLPELRQQYDVLDREIDRLAHQFQAEQDPVKKQAILVQAQKLDYARQELEGQLKGAEPRPGVAPVEGQGQLDFNQPYPKDRLPNAPVVIGEQKATPNQQAIELEFAKQRLQAGAPLTPAQQLLLRQEKAPETAAPQLELPVEVGAGARPTSYVVDDKAIKTFGFTKKATKIKDAIRGLDLMNPEDRAKFDDLIAKHERNNAKVDMQAVEDFKASMPEEVQAREIPEAAGLPAREYTPRQQYQQAREAMFAFGQQAAPISPRDRAFLAKQKYEAENGPISRTGPGTSEPSVSLPSGELQPAQEPAAPTITGLAGAEPNAGRPTARTRVQPIVKPSPLAQMAQQLAPEGKPALKEEKVEEPKKRWASWSDTVTPKKSRKGTAYRTATPSMTGMSVKDVQGVVNRIVDGWKNSPLIQVVQFENQLPPSIQAQIERDGVVRPQGVWDEDSQAVFLIADNIESQKDVTLTVAHEALGHYGLRTILGDAYSKTMNQMYQNSEVKRRADNKIDRGMDKETAVEEVLAEMAEKHTPPTVVQKLINILRQLMAKAGFPMKGVTNSEIKALLEKSRQFVIEGKGEAGKGGMKVGKVFSGDAPIFYSRLAAMTQHAPKNLREGATGKQWADWINSNAGKFGVKKEEIEWTGINDELALFTTKLDPDFISRFLDNNKISIGEVLRGGPKDEAKIQELNDKIRESKILHKQLIKQIFKEGMSVKSVFSPQFIGAFTTPQGKFATMHAFNNLVNATSAELKFDFLRDPSTWTVMQNQDFSTYGIYDRDLDYGVHENFKTPEEARARLDEIKDAYRNRTQIFDPEPIIRSQKFIETYENRLAREEEGYTLPTRFDRWSTHGGKNYGELVLRLPSIKADYKHQHWPKVVNPVAHTRFSEFTDEDGKRVLLVDEVQSDWGQQATKYGLGTEENMAKYHRDLNTAIEEANRLAEIVNTLKAKAIAEGRMRDSFDMYSPEVEEAANKYAEVQNAIDDLTYYPPVANAPFIKDTKAWTALVVKRLLRYAADNGISRIAFIDGQTAHERFPKDEHGKSTEKGMKTYYDQILPSVVKEVLHKLGADSKPTSSNISLDSKPGYSIFVDGELVDGPYDNEQDAINAGADLYFSGAVQNSDDIKIRPTEDPKFKSFLAYDLAPETAEKVKEGQALFRSTIPRYTKLSEPATIGKSVKDVLSLANKANRSTTWENFRIAAVDPTSGLGRVLSSLPENDKQLRGDILARAFAQVNNVINNGLQTGVPVLNSDGSVIIERNENNLAKSRELAIKLDSNPEVQAAGLTGMDYVAEIARRLRGKEIMAADEVIRKNAEAAMQTADRKIKESQNKKISHAESRKLYNEAIALRKRYKDDVNLNREMQVKPEDIKWAEDQVAKVPEVQQILDIWRNINESLIDLRRDGGLITKELAAELKKNVSYVPLFAAEEDLEAMRDPNRTVTGSGTKSVDKMYRLEGTERLTRNIWENLYKQYAITTAAVYQNQVRKIGTEQLISVGGGRFTDNPSEANVRYRDAASEHADSNGIVSAVVDDPNALAAFQVLHYELTPLMKGLSASTRVLRAGALINPMYWVKQLIRDPLHSTLAGRTNVVTPVDSIREFIDVLRNNSEEAKILASRGVIGAVDSTVDLQSFLKQIGEKNVDPSKLDKAIHKIMKVHEASDAATRIAIYKKAYADGIKQGMPKEQAISYGVMKARESANFSVHGNSNTLNTLRHMIPFFSAAITSLDTVYRAATGYNLNPEEKAKAQQMFRSRAITMALMTMAYAMMLQDDEDYKRLPDEVKDANWLLPNPLGEGKSFIKIPVPFEVGFLFKTIPETVVRYLAGNSSGKDVLASYKTGVLQNLPGNGIPIPQAAKPLLEHMTNYSFFTGRALESAGDQNLPVHMRGMNASEVAKTMSGLGLDKIGLSPTEIDNYIQGYTAQLGTFATNIADAMINAAEGKSTAAKNIEQMPGFKAFMTNPNVSKAVGDFYALQREAVEVVHELNQLKKYGKRDEIKAFLENETNRKLVAIEPTLRKMQTQMSNLRTQAKIIEQNQNLEPEVRRQRVNLFMEKYDEVARQYKKIVERAKL